MHESEWDVAPPNRLAIATPIVRHRRDLGMVGPTVDLDQQAVADAQIDAANAGHLDLRLDAVASAPQAHPGDALATGLAPNVGQEERGGPAR